MMEKQQTKQIKQNENEKLKEYILRFTSHLERLKV